MENDSKQKIPTEREEDFLEPYYKKSRFTFTFWRWVVMGIACAAAAVFYKVAVIDTAITDKELLAATQLFDIDSQWTVTEKIRSADFTGLRVMPEVSFRIRNLGEKDLSFVYFIAVFRYADNGKALGEQPQMTLRRKLPPGGESERVVIKAPHGFQATSLESFTQNPKEWRKIFVELFAKSKGSKTALLKTVFVSHRIAGSDIDVVIK